MQNLVVIQWLKNQIIIKQISIKLVFWVKKNTVKWDSSPANTLAQANCGKFNEYISLKH